MKSDNEDFNERYLGHLNKGNIEPSINDFLKWLITINYTNDQDNFLLFKANTLIGLCKEIRASDSLKGENARNMARGLFILAEDLNDTINEWRTCLEEKNRNTVKKEIHKKTDGLIAGLERFESIFNWPDFKIWFQRTYQSKKKIPEPELRDEDQSKINAEALTRDIFICHASEDKPGVIRPLTQALDKEGISYWLDEAEITWGDSITKKVNEGLSMSRFTIVVLSQIFLSKNWPQRELNAVLNMEASSGEVKILPLVVGDGETRQKILKRFPLLNDKVFLSWEGKSEPIINALKQRLLNITKDQIVKSSKMSNITFPQNEYWDGVKGAVVFWAEKEEEKITCAVSSQALEDHFNASPSNHLPVFKTNRSIVEDMAKNLIQKGRFEADGSIIVKTRDFF